MTWESRRPRLSHGAPEKHRPDASSVRLEEERHAVNADELLRLGISPCGLRYFSQPWDLYMTSCGRPAGHSGPHWAEASQRDVLGVAGIEEWVNQ